MARDWRGHFAPQHSPREANARRPEIGAWPSLLSEREREREQKKKKKKKKKKRERECVCVCFSRRSFHDTHKVYSRLEAMKVAKEQVGHITQSYLLGPDAPKPK